MSTHKEFPPNAHILFDHGTCKNCIYLAPDIFAVQIGDYLYSLDYDPYEPMGAYIVFEMVISQDEQTFIGYCITYEQAIDLIKTFCIQRSNCEN